MITNLFIILYTLYPLCIAVIFAAIVYKPIYRIFRKRIRKAHKAQAAADMAAQEECYQWLMLYEVRKGNNYGK